MLMQSGREADAERLFEQASELCHSMGLTLPDVQFDRVARVNSA
jgi:hypothetical protein